MRWLFLFVLALNLVYIGLEISSSPADDYADVPPLKNVKTIVLLSELKQPSVPDVQVAADEMMVDEVLQESSPTATSAGAAAGQAEKAQADVVLDTTEKAISGQAVASLPTETEKMPETKSASAQSQLIAENIVTDAQASAAPEMSVEAPAEKSVEEVPAVKPSVASCFTLGPFRDLARLRGLTREIKTYVVNADFRGREEKEPTLYWVYVKPEKNRKQAIKTGKRLKAKKIKDFYVIREGEKINGLSLGHFRNKKGAYRLAKKVRKLGFDVVVEPVFRTYTIYWLDYQLVDGAVIPEPVLEKYTRSGKKEKITRLSRDCGV